MITEYKILFNSCYTKIKMYDLSLLPESDADDIMFDTIRPSIIQFRGCRQNLKDRNDEAKIFNFDLDDENIEILSNYMVINYLNSNFILTQTMLKPYLSNTDFHNYGNKDLLAKAMELKDKLTKENKQLMIDYSYTDSVLFKNPERLKGRK